VTAAHYVGNEDIFLKVVECKHFAAAAKMLSLPSYTVSRRIQQLEQRLDTVLLRRNARSVGLTEAGKIYYDYCLKVFEARVGLSIDLGKQAKDLSGDLRISAPPILVRLALRELVEEFASMHSGITAIIVPDSNFVDLVKEDFDLAFRVGRLANSSLRLRRLPPASLVLVAAAQYVEFHGAPQTPHDIAAFDVIVQASRSMPQLWTFHRLAEIVRVPATGQLVYADPEIVADACMAGKGIALVPELIIRDAVASGHLVQLLPQWQSEAKDVSIIFSARSAELARVRAFIDFAVSRLATAAPWSNPASADRTTVAAPAEHLYGQGRLVEA
jgi:DNA-binding transcriptional LysR family regulator